MNGFKSFAKHTELIFNSNYNVVLGPNGSGKSNVLDALCFVLGKTSSKSLRAERASNLIYNGGKSRKPAKQGEVTIYFDNKNKTFPTEDQEIKVTRIVRQNGQSIYKINDQVRTRQEIVDLLAIAKINPDAHNIILQGDIIKFVEMSPVERRMLVEEIAGISVYEEKKGKALRELERVDERLKESEIILQERDIYLKDLKKDRNQALKYKELNDKVQQNQATVYFLQIRRKEEDLKEVKEKLEKETKKLNEMNEEILNYRKKIKEKKDEIDHITKEVEERGEVGQVNLNKDIENLKIEITKHNARVETCRAEIEKMKARKIDLNKEIESTTEKIAAIKEEQKAWKERDSEAQKQKREFRQKIDEFRKKHNLDDVTKIEEQIEQMDKKIDTLQTQVNAEREQQHNWLREKDVLEHMIKTADEKIDKVALVASENKAQIEKLKEMRSEFKKHTLDLNRRLDEDSTLVAKLTSARKEFQALSEDVSKLEARAYTMREQSGQDRAIAEILDLKKTNKGIFGTVAELGEVSSKYALALEAAAGGRLRSIVVDTDATAAECIKYLKQRQAGRATFLPVNKMRSKVEDPDADKVKGQGIHGKAIDLVRFDSRFKAVFGFVLGETIIVDNIEVARKIGIGSHKMATIDGDITERSGAMQGGFSQKRKGASGFREQELNENLEKKQKDLEELQSRITAFESRRADNEEIITGIRTKKAELEGEVIKLEKSLNLENSDIDVDKKKKEEFRVQLKGVEEKLEAMQSKVMDMNRDTANFKMERQRLRDQTVQIRNPSKLAELATYEDQLRKASQSELEAASKFESLDKQVSEIFSPELHKIKTLQGSIDVESSKFEAEIKLLMSKLQERNVQLEEKEKQAKMFYAKFKSLFGDRNKLNDDVNVLEIKINGLVDQSRQFEIKQNTFTLKVEECNNELGMLKELFRPFEGIPVLENASEQQLKSEITRFENMRNDIGSVNMRALEIYDEVEKEYNSLHAKKETLQKEKEDVLGLIGEIEGRKKELFMKAFDMVQNNFKTIFASLSTKGEANLVLENPENPFMEGLRVSVRLTGNKFMDIRSLSGGEKTMTALAFIFAIQEHEPASFYVLDEVDAALDKHNSMKLAELVGKYAQRAQYIMISHNDGVISSADTLYGVSMNEHGMSTVVSLKM